MRGSRVIKMLRMRVWLAKATTRPWTASLGLRARGTPGIPHLPEETVTQELVAVHLKDLQVE